MTSSAQLGCACVCVEDYEEKWSERYLQQAASMQKAQLQGKERGGVVRVPARPGRGRRGPGRPRKAWLAWHWLPVSVYACAWCAQGMEPCP